MNGTMKKQLRSLSEDTGLKLDEKAGVLYGSYRGHNMCIKHVAENVNAKFIMVAVSRDGKPLSSEEIEQFISSAKDVIKSYKVIGNQIEFMTKHGITMKKDFEKNKAAIEAIASFLNAGDCVDCCQTCGETGCLETYFVGGVSYMICPDCLQKMTAPLEERKNSFHGTKSNAFLGTVGALLGSVLGVLAIIVISQLGYVAAISGVIMGVCTIFGYEKLSKKLDMKGIIISTIIMLGMVYFANNLDWAVTVVRSIDGVNFFDAYQALPALMKAGVIEMPVYYGALAMTYLFVLLGAVPICFNTFKTQKNQYEIRKAA